MSWQDELRRLDDELSAGRLSAEDYRRRRDDLTAQDPAGPGDEEPPPAPFPPAFRWETVAPSDETQVIPAIEDDAERTQVVSDGPPSYRPGWDESAPPWASADLPPVWEPAPGWAAAPQFTAPERHSGTGLIVGVVAAVVILALVGFGVYWFVAGEDTPQAGGAPAAEPPAASEAAAPAPPPSEAPAPPESTLPDPAPIGGDGEPRTLLTSTDLGAAGVLTPDEFLALEQAGIADSKLLITTFADGPRATILITRVADAPVVRDGLAALQEGDDLEPAPGPPGLSNFLLREDPAGMTVVRGFYTSGDVLVRIEVIGPELVPSARRYDTIVEQQIATLAADV